MINLLYVNDSFDYSVFNKQENTFSKNDINDEWSFEWLLKSCNVKFNQSTSLKKNKQYYCLNLNSPTSYEDLNNLPFDIWHNLKNFSNVFLLLYQATEPNTYFFYSKRWINLVNFLKQQEIPAEKIFYISGDIRVIENHAKQNIDYISNIAIFNKIKLNLT